MMKKKLIVIILIVIILAAGVGFKRAPRTGHLLGYPGDSWYMLCADGHWEIENNGLDSIRPVCVGD